MKRISAFFSIICACTLFSMEVTHEVKKGETLSSIARSYNLSYTKIKDANKLKSNNIHVGQKLIIPLEIYKAKNDKKITKIEKDIQTNQSKLEKESQLQTQTAIKVKLLAKQISTQTQELNALDKDITKVNEDIKEHEEELTMAKKVLEELQTNTQSISTQKQTNEKEIIDTIIEQFSSSLALDLASKETTQQLIDKELYTILSEHSKEQIVKLDTSYLNLTEQKGSNEKKIAQLQAYIKQSQEKKNKLNAMIESQKKSIAALEEKHTSYKQELKNIVQKQNDLKSLLGKLNIFKKDALVQQQIEIEKEKRRILQEDAKERSTKTTKVSLNKSVQDQLAENIDMDIRMLGSSTKGVKIARYTGKKAKAPLDSYEVFKEFGTYYDPIYKIKLFNESIILKTNKTQAKVYNVMDGKIVYAKQDSGLLENVVIIKHKNNLHTVYSHLDEIAPTLREGKWVEAGYVVGRVNDTLTFQVTKDDHHINPKDLFN